MMIAEYYVGWWNLENLFDIERSSQRPDWLKDRLKKELKGWTRSVLNKKLNQLARVIAFMNNQKGPDLLGVCEVENKDVLKDLVAVLHATLPHRRYKIAHSDTADKRGIDVAFIYDSSLFSADKIFNRVIIKRNATRDLLQVNFSTIKGNALVVIGNHWPSRLGGAYESEPFRIIAGETLAYWHERILEIKGEDTPIVVLGDFNDEPFDRSLSEYGLSERENRRVKSLRSRKPYLLNLMWPLMGAGSGTHFFDTWGVLDQALVNRPLLRTDSPI
jgi:predicted extracellular nuclease